MSQFYALELNGAYEVAELDEYVGVAFKFGRELNLVVVPFFVGCEAQFFV